jgi:hypothetical protein
MRYRHILIDQTFLSGIFENNKMKIIASTFQAANEQACIWIDSPNFNHSNQKTKRQTKITVRTGLISPININWT